MQRAVQGGESELNSSHTPLCHLQSYILCKELSAFVFKGKKELAIVETYPPPKSSASGPEQVPKVEN